MARLTGRNLTDNAHRALRMQAVLHGRSTEAEVREILSIAVKPDGRVGIGDTLAALSRSMGLTNADFEGLNQVMDQAKDKTPAESLVFE